MLTHNRNQAYYGMNIENSSFSSPLYKLYHSKVDPYEVNIFYGCKYINRNRILQLFECFYLEI